MCNAVVAAGGSRRYEVPPGEDAMSPDNVLGLNAAVNSLGYSDGECRPVLRSRSDPNLLVGLKLNNTNFTTANLKKEF